VSVGSGAVDAVGEDEGVVIEATVVAVGVAIGATGVALDAERMARRGSGSL